MKIRPDRDRIAARYADLLADQDEPVRPVAAGGYPMDRYRRDWWANCGKAGGKNAIYDEVSSWDWERLGIWPDPPAERWISVADLEGQMAESQEAARRRWEQIMQVVVTAQPDIGIVSAAVPAEDPPGDALTAMRLWMNDYKKANLPRPTRVEAGSTAVAAIAAMLPVATGGEPPAYATGAIGAMAGLTGIPIVPNDEDLEPGQWRLVDAVTGEVLNEGTISPDLAEYVRAMKEAAEQLANETDVPRDMRIW